MKHLLVTLLLLCSSLAFGQIGPSPTSSINTWRVEEVYSAGQAVIRDGVVYQSLVDNNVAFDPAGSPSQWTTVLGSTGGGSTPTGNAGGALGGTYPNPTLATAIKVINGISYSTAYTGATVDVRVNACISDAMTLANGNYTGICDATGETGTQVTAAQITLGDSNGTPVTLFVPSQGQWRGGMTDGTSSTMLQYGNTAIIGKGPESGIGTQFVFGATTTSNLAYVFKLQPLVSQLNYINDSNFAIVNVNGGPYVGHVTTQGIGAYFQGSMFDSSTLDHIVVFDSLDAISAYMPNWCCGATMRNVSINGNYGTGVTPLVISGTSALNLETLSVVHPGVGKPAIQVTDSTFNVSNLNIHGLYIETSQTDATTALIQLQGYGSVFIDNLTAKAEAASMSASIITSTNTTNTGITVNGFTAVNGGGNWQLPVTVINNSFTGQVTKGDSAGSKSNLGYYTNGSVNSNSLITGIITTTGLTDTGTGVFNSTLSATSSTAATSGANHSSPQFQQNATYWTGAASANDNWLWQDLVGSGTNPISTYKLLHTGSSGAATVSAAQPWTFLTESVADPSFGSSQLNGPSACESAYGITTLSTSASFTNSGLFCLPATAVIDAVTYRVTTTITGAGVTGFTIGDTVTGTRFCGTQSTLTAGTTGVCLAQSGTATQVQGAAGQISVSTGSTPSAGAIRLIVYYHTWTAPTS